MRTKKRKSWLIAPFPYFGGKSAIASEVWKRFGDIRNYMEPFLGSGAVLLRRPPPFHGREITNDLDGFVANFWRAVQKDPDEVARHADWPANDNDYQNRYRERVWFSPHCLQPESGSVNNSQLRLSLMAE